ncbi:phage holin family protein [Paenibacillus fonticola]|uniref:phage holin family protein n=1 Tax=Paenibacillus fonticola TaxID=379896 RepID=UPI00036F2E7B|nr:phage holin family protein [Paenibacillus fonticola]
MNWNDIFELIHPVLFGVVAACWVIGFVLKKTPKVPDWSIIYIVTVVAVLLTVWLLGWGPESFIQGILTGAFAVYGNQFVKQAMKGADRE